jgi:hypothetical protein
MARMHTLTMQERATTRARRLGMWLRRAIPMSTGLVPACLLLLSVREIRAQGQPPTSIDTARYTVLRVKPSTTNAAIHFWDTTHVVYYDPTVASNKILLWLAGTNGTPLSIPRELFATALAQGYRIVALSYITSPAVSQTCVGDVLDANANCAEMFRRKRIYGDNAFSLIGDEPVDAIIPRFVSLLQWLSTNDARGKWSRYLSTDSAKLRWTNIAVAGQSQGGGMAQFIAQRETVARMISFSGGWDYANSKEKKIAPWYANGSVTPMEKWYATFHVNELAAAPLREIYAALRIPLGHVFALDRPLLNANPSTPAANPYHGEGIRNSAYQPIWRTMLGSGIN